VIVLNRIEAESMKLSGYKVIRTKRKYYLTGDKVRIRTGYAGY